MLGIIPQKLLWVITNVARPLIQRMSQCKPVSSDQVKVINLVGRANDVYFPHHVIQIFSGQTGKHVSQRCVI